jgi:probable phosphoglycerate mutase
MKTIYIIRHGETDFNKEKRVQGSGIDTDINDTGRLQGQAFYDMYHNIQFDKIYVSQLKRTHQTIAPFLTNTNTPHEIRNGLNEISWGLHEGRVSHTLDKEYYEWLLGEWNSGNTHVPVRGGESPEDVALRQRLFLNHLTSDSSERTVLICMHGRAMKIMLCQMLGLPLQEMYKFEHSNTCLYVVEYVNNEFNLLIENDIHHLERISVPV